MEEKSDSKPFDTTMKQLAGGSPQAWVSLLVLAKSVIEGGMSLQQLQALEDKLYSAVTIEEATTALRNA